jgi:hypothetical protein
MFIGYRLLTGLEFFAEELGKEFDAVGDLFFCHEGEVHAHGVLATGLVCVKELTCNIGYASV